jgi:hypothetical protein
MTASKWFKSRLEIIISAWKMPSCTGVMSLANICGYPVMPVAVCCRYPEVTVQLTPGTVVG